MHDRYGAYVDTLIVISNNKVWRIWADSGEIFYEADETWPKDVRDYYKAKHSLYDKVFPIVDGFYAEVRRLSTNG